MQLQKGIAPYFSRLFCPLLAGFTTFPSNMSVVQGLSNLVSLSVSTVTLNPVVTASLLWVLTRGPENVRGRLLNAVSSLQNPKTLANVVKALKVLLAVGVAGSVNGKLNQLALNAWRIKSEKKKWNWNQEIAVVTGGCSGIGELVVKRLINRGLKVAVLDIQQLPPSLQGCREPTRGGLDRADENPRCEYQVLCLRCYGSERRNQYR